MDQARAAQASTFARQILDTTAHLRGSKDVAELDILDVGCGYADTARELARLCHSVTGIEPSAQLAHRAQGAASSVPNLIVRQTDIVDLERTPRFDLVVMDNVYEHLPDQPDALSVMSSVLRPGGTFFLLTPNRLWPIEAHYRLPFLSYLPLSVANRYLRLSRRGSDYSDASYARSTFTLTRQLNATPKIDWAFTLPASRDAMSAMPFHYRLGIRLISRYPALWTFSKALLVVGRKRA